MLVCRCWKTKMIHLACQSKLFICCTKMTKHFPFDYPLSYTFQAKVMNSQSKVHINQVIYILNIIKCPKGENEIDILVMQFLLIPRVGSLFRIVISFSASCGKMRKSLAIPSWKHWSSQIWWQPCLYEQESFNTRADLITKLGTSVAPSTCWMVCNVLPHWHKSNPNQNLN